MIEPWAHGRPPEMAAPGSLSSPEAPAESERLILDAINGHVGAHPARPPDKQAARAALAALVAARDAALARAEAAESEVQQWRDSIATEALRWRAEEAEAQLEAARQAAARLRPFKPKALADQYLVCINQGDWESFLAAVAVSPGEPDKEQP